MDTKQQESVDLKGILQSFNLSNSLHTTLVDQGFGSIEILSQCTEQDIEQLSNELSLNLVDKLKLKQALKSINIPRESIKYAVINQEEQNSIFEIHQSIKQVENIIIENNINTNELQNQLNTNKQQICNIFDSIHQMVNQKKENILNTLEFNFENKQIQNEQFLKYLNEAKNITLNCQNLILNKNNLSDIETRNQSIIELKDTCLSKLSKILQLNTKTNVQINNDIQSIQQYINNLVTFTDAKDTKFKFRSIVNDQKEQETFSDSKSIINNENINTSNIKQTWQYTQHEFGSFDDTSTTVEHFKSLNTNTNINVNPIINQKQKQLQNEDENHSEITFKPLVKLEEQNVESGHENEELINSFKINKLYYFGKDVTGQQTWKLRATKTALEIYNDKRMKKIRLICREFKTSKLRLNHYIPPKDRIQLNCKSDKLIIWSAYDVTIEENYEKNSYSTLCAKFHDAKTASEFRMCFEKCQSL